MKRKLTSDPENSKLDDMNKPSSAKPALTEEEQRQLVEQSRRFAVPERPPQVEDFWAGVREYLDRNQEPPTT